VAKKDFQLMQGEDDLAEYQFNTGTARHLFCRYCGVKSFYVPRSHPGGYSVNLNCLELDKDITIETGNFDGRHWRRNIKSLLEDG
jgi:hypothetical protein